jgi:hypothetical protein
MKEFKQRAPNAEADSQAVQVRAFTSSGSSRSIPASTQAAATDMPDQLSA